VAKSIKRYYLYRRTLMKSARLLIFLPLIAIYACATAHKNVPVEQDMIPDWRLGYEHLDILEAALERENDVLKITSGQIQGQVRGPKTEIRKYV
jgi:hypothetical protein